MMGWHTVTAALVLSKIMHPLRRPVRLAICQGLRRDDFCFDILDDNRQRGVKQV